MQIKVLNMNKRRELLKTITAGLLLTSGGSIAFASNNKGLKSQDIVLIETVEAMVGNKKVKEDQVVKTLGYYAINDGGQGEYLICKNTKDVAFSILLDNGLYAVPINLTAVNYKVFGSKCNGIDDDGIYILKAHQYAVKYNVPINNLSGEFWIKDTNGIPIQTSVNWGETIFHIDEAYNTPKAFKFSVDSKKKKIVKTFSNEQKQSILKELVPGVDVVTEFKNLSGSLIYIEDENDRIGFRAGASFDGQSWARQEFFYVEEHGKIIGEVAYSFKDFTNLEILPIDDTYLTINGGCFVLSGNSSGKGYTKNGIGINRSRVQITNQIIRLGEGKIDTAPNARTGFYNFSKVYDVLLENIKLIPYEQDREGKENDVPAGTYGISGNRILNATFRNVTAEGSQVHWGIFGTNMNKNFKIDGCILNRVDVHFHCWNLSILNSKIGFRGISVTGGGDLIVQNSSVNSRSFLNFRRDFGSKWEGNIYVSNCKFIPTISRFNTFLDFNPEDFNYRYPVMFGESIVLKDIVIDNRFLKEPKPLYMIYFPNFSTMKHGDRIGFPQYIEMNNINCITNNGVRIIRMAEASGYALNKKGSDDDVYLETNCKMFLRNISLEDFSNSEKNDERYHFIVPNSINNDMKEDSLFLNLEIDNCDNLALDFRGIPLRLNVQNSLVSSIRTKTDNVLQGSMRFNSCSFMPKHKIKDDVCLELDSKYGTYLTNCNIYSPKILGDYKPENMDKYEFLKINSFLRLNHINTRFGNDILKFLKQKGIILMPSYLEKMKLNIES